jgi:uncharacterized lipoprotein YajG
MTKYFLLVFALLFSGCSAQYPATTNLNLEVGNQPYGIYASNTSAALKGHDARLDTAVVIYHLKGKSPVRIPNHEPPHKLVTEQLATGLQEQGLVFESGSSVRILIDLNDLVAIVTRGNLLYSATAKSNLTLTIKNKETSLIKTYNRQANRDSAGKPSVQDLEKMLNDHLNDIVSQILQDEEVQAAINKK